MRKNRLHENGSYAQYRTKRRRQCWKTGCATFAVIFTRDEKGNVKDGHHDLTNIIFVDQADIREIPA